MAETLSTISLVSFVAAGVFGILTVVLWFLFKIPTVIGDLSGRSAKKSIELMRKNNEKKTDKPHTSDVVNVRKGKLISRIKNQGKGIVFGQNDETGLLNENMATGYSSIGTELLDDGHATKPLQDANETVPLEAEGRKLERKVSTVKIILLEEIMYIHTEEVI